MRTRPSPAAASAFTSPIDYAGLVYGKGPYMYRALRTELGDETFFAGLRQYVTTYRMRIAPPRGVIDALATGTHARRVRQLATRWLEQRHGDDDLGRGVLVEYRAAALGKSITYVLAYDFARAPHEFSWRLVRGDLLRRLDGTYRLEPDGDATRVHYELLADLAAPLPGLVKRRAPSIIMGSALRDLKRRVEAIVGGEH